MAFDKQILHGDKKQQAAAKKGKSDALKSYQGAWKMKYDMVYAFSQIGALMGRQWGLAWKIVNGNYPTAPKNKAGVAIKLMTNSQLNLIPGMDEEEANMLMQRVIDGELDRGDLRKECLKRNAYEDMRKNAIDIINSKTRSDRDIKEKKFTVSTWDEVEAKFPVIANKKFMDGWLTAFLNKKKKAPAPVAFSAAIGELLDNMHKRAVLTFKLVLLVRPLFMKRPSHLLTPSLVETPCDQRELHRGADLVRRGQWPLGDVLHRGLHQRWQDSPGGPTVRSNAPSSHSLLSWSFINKGLASGRSALLGHEVWPWIRGMGC